MSKYDDLTRRLLERRQQYVAAQKKKKRVLVSTITSLCVVAMVGVAVWQMPDTITQPLVDDGGNTSTTVTTTQPTKPTYNILWADSESDDNDGFFLHEGREYCYCLYDVLEDPPVDKIAIRVEGGVSAYFVYKGKTIEEYREAYVQERRLFRLLTQLVKEGEDLKYGEALYTTGGPDGVIWAREFYEERVELYGEELLSKYIVDGEFLKAEVEAEIERRLNGYHTAQDADEEAIDAAKRHAIAQLKTVLDSLGLDYEEQTDAGELVFFATVDEFLALPTDAVCGTCHWAAKGNDSDDLFCDYD